MYTGKCESREKMAGQQNLVSTLTAEPYRSRVRVQQGF